MRPRAGCALVAFLLLASYTILAFACIAGYRFVMWLAR